MRKNFNSRQKRKSAGLGCFYFFDACHVDKKIPFDNTVANRVAEQWTDIISAAFVNGIYNHDRYVSVYSAIMKIKPNGGRRIDFVNFYPIVRIRSITSDL